MRPIDITRSLYEDCSYQLTVTSFGFVAKTLGMFIYTLDNCFNDELQGRDSGDGE